MKRAFWLLLLIGALLLAGCAGSGSYTASGYIFDDEGNPIEGVELVLSGGSSDTITADAQGYWETEAKGTVTIIPRKEGYAFQPKEAAVTKQEPQAIFTGVTGKIIGRVSIAGEPPGREVVVTVEYGESGTEEILTDENGEFKIPLDKYPGEEVWISTYVPDSFTSEEQEEYDLLRWVYIYVPLEPAFLPDLDLYSYGLGLQKPTDGEEISGFPYEVEISPYDREVDNLLYYLYFYTFDDTYLGSTDDFTGTTFSFDGELSEGTAEQDLDWYLGAEFQQDGYYLFAYAGWVTVFYRP